MRAKIRAEKTEDGYRMICILPTTYVVEYPQEGKVHPTKASVYADAAIMYGRSVAWLYNERNHTIKID